LFRYQATSVQNHRRQVYPPGELSVKNLVGKMPTVKHFRRWLQEPSRHTALIIIMSTRVFEPGEEIAAADVWYALFAAARWFFEWYVENPGQRAPDYVYNGYR
jgi:hypothetical protein